jgi:hypothetical protein
MLQPGLDKETIMHLKSTYTKAPSRVASLDIETLAPPALDDKFPQWPTHRPIVASVLTADQAAYGEWTFGLESITFDDERVAIMRINELLAGRRCVTFNGKGFDLPVLTMTAMRASVFDCDNLTNAWVANRNSGSHIDVADLITNFGSAPRTSLEMLCESAGIPVKGCGHGRDVADMLRDEGMDAIKRYCEEDVTSTLALFALVQGLRSNDPAYASSLISDLATWIADSGLEHLNSFRCLSWNTERARIRLMHRVDEGIRALEDRATKAYFGEKTLAF